MHPTMTEEEPAVFDVLAMAADDCFARSVTIFVRWHWVMLMWRHRMMTTIVVTIVMRVVRQITT